jgi:hypothetical protein
MRPLTNIAAGLIMVVIDLRTEHLDLLPDTIGWALVALGAWRMAMTGPALAASTTALLTVPEVSLPYSFVMVDPRTGETIEPRPNVELGVPRQLVFDHLSGWRVVMLGIGTVAAGATMWLLLGALSTRAGAWERAVTARRLQVLRWLALVAWVVPYLVVVIASVLQDGSFDPVWNDRLELVALPGLAVVAALAVLLFSECNRAWAVPQPAAGWAHRSWLRRPNLHGERPG